MAFPRVNPSGWAIGAKLTSSQQNQLDIDHANAIDKTGDNPGTTPAGGITGNVSVNSGGEIEVLSGGIITVDSSGQIAVSGSLDMNSGSSLFIASGGELEIGSGGAISVDSGATFTAVVASGKGYLSVPDPTYLKLSNASRTIFQPFEFERISSTGTWTTTQATGYANFPGFIVGANGGNSAFFFHPIDEIHDGATLTSVALVMANVSTYTPTVSPRIDVIAYTMVPGAGISVDSNFGGQSLFTNSSSVSSPVAISGYTPSASLQSYSVNIVNSTASVVSRRKRYLAYVSDDNTSDGIGSIAMYFGFALTYSSIPDMSFQ